MIETEQRLERAAERMAGSSGHGLPAAALDRAIAAAGSGGLVLGGEQQAALAHVAERGDLALVLGYAGTGKSAMLGIARDGRSEEPTSELQSLMRISYAVFCLKT